MNFIKNLKISQKLLGSFAIMLAAMIIIGVMSIRSLYEMDEYLEEMYHSHYQASMAIQEVLGQLNLVSAHMNRVLNPNYSDKIEESSNTIAAAQAFASQQLDLYNSLIKEEFLHAEYALLTDLMGVYRDARNRTIEFARAGDYEAASRLNDEETIIAVGEARNQITKVLNYEKQLAEEMLADATDAINSDVTFTIIITAISAVIAVFLGLFISSIISSAIKSTCKATELISHGDLTVMIPDSFKAQKDEIGDLARNIQQMRDSLYETVAKINDTSNVLNDSVRNTNDTLSILNDHITDTSAATEELSAGMEETGASAEEMHATAAEIERAVETVSEKAEDGSVKSGEIQSRAAELGKNVSQSIEKSNAIFNEIKKALEKALEDSKAVDEINALADAILGITSQTTLLALNASIEAARAGEAGRGFAVVANEISALADNSKNTVNQIQAITKVVMSAVNALATSSSNLLNFVSEDVTKDYQDMLAAADYYTNDAVYVNDMTNDLSATSEELLASVQVLMRAITEVSAAAQEGARTTTTVAEQTTDISMNAQTIVDNMKGTSDTSHELAEMVNQFKM
jgi:methyl-accepting chemotaxis protein